MCAVFHFRFINIVHQFGCLSKWFTSITRSHAEIRSYYRIRFDASLWSNKIEVRISVESSFSIHIFFYTKIKFQFSSKYIVEIVKKIPPGRLTQSKMICIKDLVDSKLFKLPECRAILLPVFCYQIKDKLESKEEVSVH